MAALLALLGEFAVELLPWFFPSADTRSGEVVLAFGIAVTSSLGIFSFFKLMTASEPYSEPAWAGHLILAFFLLSVSTALSWAGSP